MIQIYKFNLFKIFQMLIFLTLILGLIYLIYENINILNIINNILFQPDNNQNFTIDSKINYNAIENFINAIKNTGEKLDNGITRVETIIDNNNSNIVNSIFFIE
jgi:hypothetical protein